jgi:hypothetical protein
MKTLCYQKDELSLLLQLGLTLKPRIVKKNPALSLLIQCSHELPEQRHPPMHVQCRGGELARDIECDEQQPNLWNGQHHRLCWRLRRPMGNQAMDGATPHGAIVERDKLCAS